MSETFHFFYKGELSQWWKSTFIDASGVEYMRAEQYMMYQKAILFNDPETAQKILETKNPKEQQNLGRKVKGFDQKIWDENKFKLVKRGNYLKFAQNPDLFEILDATYPKTLVEASPIDKVWGIGIGEKDERRKYKERWRGQNLLGYALTEVRNELRKVKDIT